MTNLFSNTILSNPITLVTICAVTIVLIAFLVLKIKNKNLEKKVQTKQDEIAKLEERLATAENGFVLPRGVVYSVESQKEIHPGRWELVSGVEGINEFSIRHNGFVRNFVSGNVISLAEGDTLGAVSTNVIVRLPKQD